MEDYTGEHNFESTNGGFPPKPVAVEKNRNALTRSLLSLMVYALLLYFLFEQNLVYIAAVLVVVIIHEAGHFLFMKLFNYSNVKIFIVPLLGAFTSGKKQQVSQWQMCLIILAGPVPGIIIGTILYYLNRDLQNEHLKTLAISFLFINLLNCLPFYPLDGGRLIETLFFKQNHIIRLVFGIISMIIMGLFFLFNPSAYIMLVIPILIGMELYNEHKHQKIRDYLIHERINHYTDYNNLPDRDYWLIRDCLIFSFPKKYIGVNPGEYKYSFAEPLLMQHIMAVLQVNISYDLNVFKRVLVMLFYIAIFLAPVFLILSRNL